MRPSTRFSNNYKIKKWWFRPAVLGLAVLGLVFHEKGGPWQLVRVDTIAARGNKPKSFNFTLRKLTPAEALILRIHSS